MTRRPGAVLAALCVTALLVLVSGCAFGTDDEMEQPTRTVTASPSPDTTAVPATVPVGRGVVPLGEVVWAQGDRLHVGARSVDLSPVAVDAFVSVPGGVYLLHQGQLWYTDLTRLKDTGLTGVTGLGVTADGGRILVTVGASGGSAYAFDSVTGRAVSTEGLTAVTAAERLRGPDRRGVSVPPGFELVGWAGPNTFYGVARSSSRSSGRPTTVVSCVLATRVCKRLGKVDASRSLLFGTGR